MVMPLISQNRNIFIRYSIIAPRTSHWAFSFEISAPDPRKSCQPNLKQVVKVSRMVANSENLSSLVLRGSNGCKQVFDARSRSLKDIFAPISIFFKITEDTKTYKKNFIFVYILFCWPTCFLLLRSAAGPSAIDNESTMPPRNMK